MSDAVQIVIVWTSSFALWPRAPSVNARIPRSGTSGLARELSDVPRRAREGRLVEQVRGRIRDRMLRPVEIVGAGCGVQRVANRDLVTDDEYRLLGAGEELLVRGCVASRRVVEALAAGKGVCTGVRELPGAVLVERLTLELADVDVVEERLFELRHIPSFERGVCGLEGPPETRVDAEVERQLGELVAKLLRLCVSLRRERDRHARIAVDPVCEVEGRVGVTGQHEEPHGRGAYACATQPGRGLLEWPGASADRGPAGKSGALDSSVQ